MQRIKRLAGCLAVLAGTSGVVVATAVPAGAGGGVTELVSAGAGGAPLHRSHSPAISDDGRFVAFVANSDSGRNLLLRDRVAGTTTQVHAGAVDYPRVSGDGKVVVFKSAGGVLAYDVATQSTSVVNGTAEAVPGGVSDDGNFVVVRVPWTGVVLHDRAAATAAPAPAIPGVSNVGAGQVSNDGNTVVFSGLSGWRYQVFAWRVDTGAVTTASVDALGAAGTGDSFVSDLTPDGRFVAFSSRAALSPEDPNLSGQDVYVRDLVTGATEFVGANFSQDAYPQFGDNHAPVLSDDGNLVAFVTTAHIGGKWDNEYDVVLANRAADTLEVVSRATDGTPAGGVDAHVDMSGDGRFVSFASHALDLVPPFDTSECVEWEENDNEDNPWPRYIPNYGECANVYLVDRAATAAVVPSAGGTVSDGSTTVQVPAGYPGTVAIAPVSTASAIPEGYEVLGRQWQIEAPTARWDSPLRITFTVPASAGVAAGDVAVIRDGVPLTDCLGSATALPPDASSPDGYPCVTARSTASDGTLTIAVLTPHASVWTTAKVPPPATPAVTFASLCEESQAAVGQRGVAQSLCAKLTAASAARGRGDDTAADRQLAAYRNELAGIAGKWLTSAKAADLGDKSRLL